MLLFNWFKSIGNAIVKAVNSFKNILKPVKNVEKETELVESPRVVFKKEDYRQKESRPQWMNFIFDDFIKGRIKTLDEMSSKIQKQMPYQHNFSLRKN